MNFYSNWFFWLFLFFYAAYLVVEIGLDILNIKHMDKNKNNIPDLFKNVYSQEDYRKSIEYTKAKTFFGIFKHLIMAAILFIFIFTGFFEDVDYGLREILPNHPFLEAVFYPFAVFFVFMLIGMPFAYYFQFVLEEKFGFNRMTKKTFVLDQIKSMLVSFVLGFPLMAGLLWFINDFQANWWIFGTFLIMGFQIFTAAVYPVLLAPIFNKFTPLNDGTLKDRIVELAKKVNFKMAGIYTIDGSKRSSHSNAFFAGIGSMRRIVLFDTLIEKQNEDEIVSIIAHEMGHNVKKHIQKSLILSFVVMFISFYVLAFCLKWDLFFYAFGVTTPSAHVGLVLFMLFSSVFLFPISPIFTKISRKNEFEADEFSVKTTLDKQNLSSALVKLTKENLGNLTPHPLYSAYHYSHPTTIERVDAINKISL